jgi:hypothetical protein
VPARSQPPPTACPTLPRLADEATTRGWISELIAGGATDKGRMMGALSKAHKADLNGKLAQALLKEMMP